MRAEVLVRAIYGFMAEALMLATFPFVKEFCSMRLKQRFSQVSVFSKSQRAQLEQRWKTVPNKKGAEALAKWVPAMENS